MKLSTPTIFRTCLLALSSVSECSALPASRFILVRRYITLGGGTYLEGGSISPTLRYQASGIFSKGGCNDKYRIKDCFMMFEADKGMLQSTLPPPASGKKTALLSAASSLRDLQESSSKNDEDLELYFAAFPAQNAHVCGGGGGEGGGGGGISKPPPPRQRIELFSWPAAAAGENWSYEWKSHLVAGVKTSAHFFHLFQILRRDACGGPVISLDARNGQVMINDTVRKCGVCASIPLSDWEGNTMVHSLKIKYGLSGFILYSAADVLNPSVPVLKYSAVGDMGASGSLKFGMYREVVKGMSQARSFVGDYSARRG